jgi:hypothetical protein
MKLQRISWAIASVLAIASFNVLADQFEHNKALLNADKAREAKEIKEMQELRKLRQEHAMLHHTWTRTTDSATGTSLAGHGISIPGSPNSNTRPTGINVKNCLSSPEDCKPGVHTRTTGPAVLTRLQPMNSHPDHGIVDEHKNKDENTYTEHVSETKVEVEKNEGPEGNDLMREAQDTMREQAEESKGFPMIGPDGRMDTVNVRSRKQKKSLLHSQASQPLVTDGTTGTGTDPCLYNGAQCKPGSKPTMKDMAGQPVQGGFAATGGSSAPRLDNTAVSNPGDSTYVTHYSGGGNNVNSDIQSITQEKNTTRY